MAFHWGSAHFTARHWGAAHWSGNLVPSTIDPGEFPADLYGSIVAPAGLKGGLPTEELYAARTAPAELEGTDVLPVNLYGPKRATPLGGT